MKVVIFLGFIVVSCFYDTVADKGTRPGFAKGTSTGISGVQDAKATSD